MNDTFLPGSGFDTYESQDKVLMQMDGSTEAAVAVRILQQQGFAVVGAVVRLAPEQAEAAEKGDKSHIRTLHDDKKPDPAQIQLGFCPNLSRDTQDP